MSVKIEIPKYIQDTPVALSLYNVKNYEPHCHESSMEFIYCISGSATLTIAHEKRHISQGELVLVEHENIHTISAHEDNLLLSLHINLKDIYIPWDDIAYMYFSCATAFCRPHQRDDMELVYEAVLDIAYMCLSPQKYDSCCLRRAADHLTRFIVDKFPWFSIENFSAEDNIQYRDRLNRILKYIQLNYREKITLSQLAKAEYINENYFSQFIKRTPFNSFTFMLAYIRCYEAEKLLASSSLSIEEISDLCGFSSRKYFHKYFKYFWESTPFQYRKWLQLQSKLPNEVTNLPAETSLPIVEAHICDFNVRRLLKF
ncbi:MAG: AraC family transcriptional regulator [Clostridiales bacterium]|nr:AraC family transcriptional regulator [Clostridiales bacterium]